MNDWMDAYNQSRKLWMKYQGQTGTGINNEANALNNPYLKGTMSVDQEMMRKQMEFLRRMAMQQGNVASMTTSSFNPFARFARGY